MNPDQCNPNPDLTNRQMIWHEQRWIQTLEDLDTYEWLAMCVMSSQHPSSRAPPQDKQVHMYSQWAGTNERSQIYQTHIC